MVTTLVFGQAGLMRGVAGSAQSSNVITRIQIICSSMFLRQTTVSEIFNLINQLHCIKSCGADGVDVSFVKAGAVVIAPILSHSSQCMLYILCISSNLKVAKIIRFSNLE